MVNGLQGTGSEWGGELLTDTGLINIPGSSGTLTPDSLPPSMLAALRGNPATVSQSEAAEWGRSLDTLESHGVLPLIYWNAVRQGIAQTLPAEVTTRLKGAYLESWAGTARLERELASITEVLARRGVPHLVLKGPSFSRSLYPDPPTRPFGDLDLIVAPQDFALARSLIKSLGYRSKTLLGLAHHQEFGREDNRFHYHVELHRTLHKFPRIGWSLPLKEAFERAVEVQFAGRTFKALHPVDAFLYCALHAFGHHRDGIRIIWICDLARLAERFSEVEWRDIEALSVRWMARLATEEGLAMAREWFGTVIPAAFSDFRRWPAPRREELDLRETLTLQGNSGNLLKIYTSERFRLFERILAVFYLVFPPVHVMAQRYPVRSRFLLPLSYIRRWWTLLKRSMR